ncbi:hypothetical protein TSAR_009263, partial [Trichomalopsis sarcophagae]
VPDVLLLLRIGPQTIVHFRLESTKPELLVHYVAQTYELSTRSAECHSHAHLADGQLHRCQRTLHHPGTGDHRHGLSEWPGTTNMRSKFSERPLEDPETKQSQSNDGKGHCGGRDHHVPFAAHASGDATTTITIIIMF